MIGRIKGILVDKKAPEVLVDVNGIYYEIEMPMTSIYELPQLNEEVIIHTHLTIREDAHLLFGFIKESEKTMFRELIKVNGIGAKLALNILSTMSTQEFITAVNNSDITSLTKIPKVGKKMAERILIEIPDKFKDFIVEDDIEVKNKNIKEDAINALISLGYNTKQAKEMVDSVFDNKLTSEELIKEALKTIF